MSSNLTLLRFLQIVWTVLVPVCSSECSVGSRNKDGGTWIVPDRLAVITHEVIPCDGMVTQWQFWANTAGKFRAIVVRPYSSGIQKRFTIIGINDITVSSVMTFATATYTVPESDRFAVKSGDMLAFAEHRGENPQIRLQELLGRSILTTILDPAGLRAGQIVTTTLIRSADASLMAKVSTAVREDPPPQQPVTTRPIPTQPPARIPTIIPTTMTTTKTTSDPGPKVQDKRPTTLSDGMKTVSVGTMEGKEVTSPAKNEDSNSASARVSGIEISAGPESGSVIVIWDMPVNSEILHVYIRYWKASEERHVLTQQITVVDGISIHTLYGLDSNSKYHFQVQAESTTTKGSWSAIYVFTVPSGGDTQSGGTNTLEIASIAAVVVIVIVVVVAFLIYRLRMSNSNNAKSKNGNVQSELNGTPMSHHDTRNNASRVYEDLDMLYAGNSKTHESQSAIVEDRPHGYQNAALVRNERGQSIETAEYHSATNENQSHGYHTWISKRRDINSDGGLAQTL